MNERIPIFRPHWTSHETAAMAAAIQSDWWGRGPRVAKLEQAWSEQFAGHQPCIATNSGTAALELAIRDVIANRPRAGCIVVPDQTFASDANAVYHWARPNPLHFADVDPLTACLRPEDLPDCQIAAVIVVHFGGRQADVAGIRRRVRPDCVIIADCAHAHNAWHPDADYHCWSFHAVKPNAAGDGGMVCCGRGIDPEAIRADSWCGIETSTWQRNKAAYAAGYDIKRPGIKAHMNDLTAALAFCQMESATERRAKRRAIADQYRERIALPGSLPDPFGDWHLYQVAVPPEHLERFRSDMASANIDTGRHYRGLSTMTCYRETSHADCRNSRAWYASRVTLPLFDRMTDEDVDRVIEAANNSAKGWKV